MNDQTICSLDSGENMSVLNLFTERMARRRLHRLYKKQQFRTMISQEIEYSDRTKTDMTLIIIHMKKDHLTFYAIDKLVNIIQARTRTTDSIGWFDDNQLAVLLPDTTEEGAHKVITAIQEYNAPHTKISLPEFEIQSYPNHQHNTQDKQPNPVLNTMDTQ